MVACLLWSFGALRTSWADRAPAPSRLHRCRAREVSHRRFRRRFVDAMRPSVRSRTTIGRTHDCVSTSRTSVRARRCLWFARRPNRRMSGACGMPRSPFPRRSARRSSAGPTSVWPRSLRSGTATPTSTASSTTTRWPRDSRVVGTCGSSRCARGSWPGLPDDTPTARAVDQAGPVAALTLGRLRVTQAVRFLRAGAKAEARVLGAPGLVWATGLDGRNPLDAAWAIST